MKTKSNKEKHKMDKVKKRCNAIMSAIISPKSPLVKSDNQRLKYYKVYVKALQNA